MSELNELYQEVILDHNKSPRNFRELESANRKAEGYNPLCGDKVIVFLRLDGGVVQEVAFKGHGCAISTASASIMTEAIKGKSPDRIQQLFEDFRRLVMGTGSDIDSAELGKLIVFHGVSEFPIRVKCATLPWHTLQAALAGTAAKPVSTE